MEIVDVFQMKGDTFLYCVGEEIKNGFSCRRISVEGKQFDIEASEVNTSISGCRSLVLKVKKPIKHGLRIGKIDSYE